MAIPVIALDEAKTILARPRNSPIYDSNVDLLSVAAALTLTFFRNLVQFPVVPSVAAQAKVYGKDTNLESASGGAIPKGSMFLCYDLTVPASYRELDLSTNANVAGFEQIARLRRSRALTFKFADTPFFTEPLAGIPSGVGIDSLMHTGAGGGGGANVWPVKNGRLHRENRRRMTIAGYPLVLTQNEQFSIEFVSYADFQVTLAATPGDLFWTTYLHGLFIKGLQG